MAKQIVKKILWIDDMINWSSIMQENLQILAMKKNINLVLVHRSNGEDLKLIFQNIDFDLIVMDYLMEPFNGDSYVKEIREEEHLSGIPILFYSQDTEAKLDELVKDVANVKTLFRPHLEDEIRALLKF